MTHAECLAALSAKFDTLLTKLQTAIFRRSSLHVNANGTYTADEHEGYGTVVVDVPAQTIDYDFVEQAPLTLTVSDVFRPTFSKNGNTVTYVPAVTVAIRKQELTLTENGRHAVIESGQPADVITTGVTVNVPNNITFERFTGRYSQNSKNLAANRTWEATVSNAIMDVDTLPRTDDMHNTSFLAVFYCKSSIAQPFTAIRCKMECSMMIGDTADHVETWEVPFKMEHTSNVLQDSKYAYMAQFGLRLSSIFPNGVPEQYTAILLDKIYTEVCTGSVAQVLDAGAVTTITALANT